MTVPAAPASRRTWRCPDGKIAAVEPTARRPGRPGHQRPGQMGNSRLHRHPPPRRCRGLPARLRGAGAAPGAHHHRQRQLRPVLRAQWAPAEPAGHHRRICEPICGRRCRRRRPRETLAEYFAAAAAQPPLHTGMLAGAGCRPGQRGRAMQVQHLEAEHYAGHSPAAGAGSGRRGPGRVLGPGLRAGVLLYHRRS